MLVEAVAQDILDRTPNKLTITGGEPLLQGVEVVKLIYRLLRSKPGLDISVETNGTFRLSEELDWPEKEVSIVMDYKLSSAGILERIDPLTHHMQLGKNDWIKFVIGSTQDFTDAHAIIKVLQRNGCQAGMALSPLHGVLSPAQLAEWISLSTLRDVVLNLQIHKYIWPDAGDTER
jgi:organic radical activating enzyme